MSEPVIEVVDVQKHYGKVKAVDGLSFTIAPGEFIGFVGPNGAGKSTTIKMLTAQLLPTAGRITVGGVDVAADPNAARALIGYVPEEPRMYEYLSAREMIEFVADRDLKPQPKNKDNGCCCLCFGKAPGPIEVHKITNGLTFACNGEGAVEFL